MAVGQVGATSASSLYENEDFRYELSAQGLSIGYRHLLLRCVPYADMVAVERGWAPGWEAGGMGMPWRGDEVRIRVRSRATLPWMTVTPDDPDAFIADLTERWDASPEVAGAPPEPHPPAWLVRHGPAAAGGDGPPRR